MGYGGGLFVEPNKEMTSYDKVYFYFLFFHECKCKTTSIPYGHDVYYMDYFSSHLDSNPFYECYSTDTDDRRMCFAFYNANVSSWMFQHTEKKNWLYDKTIYVSVNGNDLNELCGSNESNPCLTVKKAFEMCEVQISLSVTLMEGNHTSETATIEIGEKKISVIGKGSETSSIEIGALSSTGALFSVTTGHLGL
ncbi:uncharacterized protein MONOS_16415 [Monocercomonoides exilis]|uniref:uncharacterized protein n=1 Tax=Monocercomonoides exilis TaxID=2049356 RepID=UPI003559C03F|nr:hypothetical protein MONOS_16415 [Monocercomonoides exilis]|eukprot:MONOS_16415.1-p1 / transcript=MONOS_16415.1 / gene=MONOS_16415 / organism=Monocercomonoides_exilis_PA203 / gene_product=unspecified product / transcript_product=unspecified product / location=Mono_scaffold01717:747-1328(-) / protein_length=194 / sequence_SO=supercontig / SO=protein_coding / is_pseudo=false